MRVSNFLLWQIAYAEIWVTDTLWPDFRRRDLLEAIARLPEARPPVRRHQAVAGGARRQVITRSSAARCSSLLAVAAVWFAPAWLFLLVAELLRRARVPSNMPRWRGASGLPIAGRRVDRGRDAGVRRVRTRRAARLVAGAARPRADDRARRASARCRCTRWRGGSDALALGVGRAAAGAVPRAAARRA